MSCIWRKGRNCLFLFDGLLLFYISLEILFSFVCLYVEWVFCLVAAKLVAETHRRIFFLSEALQNQKPGICQRPVQRLKVCMFFVCVCLWVYRCKPCLVHTFMCLILVHAKSQCCTGVAVLRRLSDMPVMGEIVRDFKVAESSSESASVFRQPGSGLPDKPLKTFNPVNSQCKSVCCTVLIHN